MSEYYDNPNENLDWDSPIENDGPEFEILPEGDYQFKVIKFERGRHEGSAKLPPCAKAILTLEVSDGVHRGTVTHNLFLNKKTEGLLCAFFTAIGQRKHGEKLIPHWDRVLGASGTCKVIKHTWTGRNGNPMESNQIDRFYEPAASVAQSYTPPATAYTPGNF